jgi:hypothetical protein
VEEWADAGTKNRRVDCAHQNDQLFSGASEPNEHNNEPVVLKLSLNTNYKMLPKDENSSNDTSALAFRKKENHFKLLCVVLCMLSPTN